MDRELLRRQLIRDEGLRLKPYKDTVGKVTIGVGRNLDDKGISEDEAAMLLDNDIDEHVADLDKHLPWWRGMDDRRQNALANMAFNLGITRLMLFTQTLDNLKRGDYEAAAAGLPLTLWYKQVGRRAVRIIEVFKGGTDSV